MLGLSLTPDLLVELARHAETEYPRECCGALLGWRGDGEAVTTDDSAVEATRVVQIVRVVACENAARDPTRRYSIHPRQLLDVHRDARRSELDVVGYYHSHPTTDGVPSAADRAESWPGLAYVIIPCRRGVAERPRAWWFTESGEPSERAIAVEGEARSIVAGETP